HPAPLTSSLPSFPTRRSSDLEAARLLRQRATALEARIAAHDQVIASLSKRGLPRLATIEVEFGQAMQRAELAWVGQLMDDMRSGDRKSTRLNSSHVAISYAVF